MKVSEQWLRDWVNPQISTEELCEQLTNLGLEVEGVENPFSHVSGIVVGEITEVQPIGNSKDHTYTLCTVDDGTIKHQVVCGAPNAKVGLSTAYARVGSILGDGTEISKATIRGFESDGMLCSPAELGNSTDQGGLIEFDTSPQLGTCVSNLLGFSSKNTIDVDLTPNRGDCLSVRGIAREVAVINELDYEEVEFNSIEPQHDRELPVRIEDPEGCPRYLGRIIKDVQSVNTPDWMAERLIGCGLRPIEPIVDITNYVMLELGQPLHAFDLVTVNKGIVVRRSKDDESLIMLDKSEIALKNDATLLITDGEKPLAIAGVMGGKDSGISSETKDVFLECAYFAPEAIQGTAREFGFHTDASHRYERGVDPDLQYRAIERATELLVQISKGIPGPVTVAEHLEHVPQSKSIELGKDRLISLIGEKVEEAVVERILSQLGFEVQDLSDSWKVTVPSRRFDVAIEEDLVEEICRVYGYNKIGSKHPSTKLSFDSHLARKSPSQRLRENVAGLGYLEVVNYSFVDPEISTKFNDESESIEVVNPMSQQLSSMRQSLIPGLLETFKYNLSRQQDTVRLFEFGKCFIPERDSLKQIDTLGGIVCGKSSPLDWFSSDSRDIDFYDLKGDLENLTKLTNGKVSIIPTECGYLHPGQSAQIQINDAKVGEFGLLHPNLIMTHELPANTLVFHLTAEPFMDSFVNQLPLVSPYPYVHRDIALLISRNVTYSQLIEIVELNLQGLLKIAEVFDVFDGQEMKAQKAGIHSDQKSIAIRLELQDSSGTLTEEAVTKRINHLLHELNMKVGAVQR